MTWRLAPDKAVKHRIKHKTRHSGSLRHIHTSESPTFCSLQMPNHGSKPLAEAMHFNTAGVAAWNSKRYPCLPIAYQNHIFLWDFIQKTYGHQVIWHHIRHLSLFGFSICVASPRPSSAPAAPLERLLATEPPGRTQLVFGQRTTRIRLRTSLKQKTNKTYDKTL